jgi:excisionase family DNA binding protein
MKPEQMTAGEAAADRFLTSAQVSDIFQVSVDVIEQMARAGELPARRVGRFWRYRRRDLEAWFDQEGD